MSIKDKIRAEIERYKQGATIARFDNAGENADYFQGKVDICDDLLGILDTLPEQRPVEIKIENPNIEKADPNVKVETRTDGTGDIDGKAMLYMADKSYKIGYRDGKASKEQPASEGLEEEMDEMWLKYCEDVDYLVYASIARHFAEWGINQCPLPEDTTIFMKGVAEGRRLEREEQK